jgi:hypothetical protein
MAGKDSQEKFMAYMYNGKSLKFGEFLGSGSISIGWLFAPVNMRQRINYVCKQSLISIDSTTYYFQGSLRQTHKFRHKRWVLSHQFIPHGNMRLTSKGIDQWNAGNG